MGVSTKQATDQYLLLQGRQFALDLLESFGEQLYSPKGVAHAIDRLTSATQNKPEGYVAGIQDIIEALQKAKP